jgi:hypothetical protein
MALRAILLVRVRVSVRVFVCLCVCSFSKVLTRWPPKPLKPMTKGTHTYICVFTYAYVFISFIIYYYFEREEKESLGRLREAREAPP